MAKRVFTPSDHLLARERAAQDDVLQKEAAKRREDRLRAAFDWLLRQENGRLVAGWLFDRCGYNRPTLMRRSSDGEVATLSTECLSAQRQVYLDFRKMVSAPELLAAAEYEAEFGPITKGEKKDG